MIDRIDDEYLRAALWELAAYAAGAVALFSLTVGVWLIGLMCVLRHVRT